jgi:superfamily II DNA or RNA helicase
VLPTGGGKTIVMAEIMRGLADRGRSAMVLVHRRELIAQTAAKLALAGVEHGIIAAGQPTTPSTIQIASVQTLARRLDSITASPDLILIDEAHHATAGGWGAILAHWPDALRLGVTATPIRLDGRGLSAVFDRLIHGPSVADLIFTGFLTEWKIYAPPQRADFSGLHKRAGDFVAGEAADAMDRPTVTGDAIEHYRRLAAGQRAIAFCCTVQHAEHVAASFRAAGIAADTLLGSSRPEDRDRLVQQFAAGQLQVLVTVDVVSEGFDIPAASCAILLRPTASLGLYLQQVGRVLRPAEGKTHAIVLDHVGNVHRHGFPDDPRDWSLDDRLKAGRGCGQAAPSVRTCPQCFAAFKPAPQCPVCGAECAPSRREIQQQEGELQELIRDRPYGYIMPGMILTTGEESLERRIEIEQHNHRIWAEARAKDPPLTRQRGAARTLPELLAVAKERGYSPGWAHKVHNARQRT